MRCVDGVGCGRMYGGQVSRLCEGRSSLRGWVGVKWWVLLYMGIPLEYYVVRDVCNVGVWSWSRVAQVDYATEKGEFG